MSLWSQNGRRIWICSRNNPLMGCTAKMPHCVPFETSCLFRFEHPRTNVDAHTTMWGDSCELVYDVILKTLPGYHR
eukprot:1417139-Rhodomonas_salina.1